MEKPFTRRDLPGALWKKWPKTDSGEPVPPRFLAHRMSVDMADMTLVGLLEAYGIPAIVRHPGDGDFGKVVLGMSGTGSSIYVPETMYNDAAALLEAEADETDETDGGTE